MTDEAERRFIARERSRRSRPDDIEHRAKEELARAAESAEKVRREAIREWRRYDETGAILGRDRDSLRIVLGLAERCELAESEEKRLRGEEAALAAVRRSLRVADSATHAQATEAAEVAMAIVAAATRLVEAREAFMWAPFGEELKLAPAEMRAYEELRRLVIHETCIKAPPAEPRPEDVYEPTVVALLANAYITDHGDGWYTAKALVSTDDPDDEPDEVWGDRERSRERAAQSLTRKLSARLAERREEERG